MVDDEVVSVEALVLGIRLRVLEEVEQKLGRLLGPATLRGAVHLGLSEEPKDGISDLAMKASRMIECRASG